MSEFDETGADNLHSDVEKHHVRDENISIVSAESEMDSIEQTLISSEMNAKAQGDSKRGACDANHPSMIKYQKDLKERLLCLLRETDEQLIDLKRAISNQDKENDHFAKQGHELQKELCLQEEKLNKIHQKYDEEIIKKHCLEEKCKVMRKNFEKVDENLQKQRKNDIDYQRKLEDIAFEVVQLTFLQNETFTDAKNLRRTVEKSTKDRENLELQKLRQDLLIFRLENDKFNLEDKINLYKVQRAIKREEVSDLRKELNAAHNEMEIISYEKQQIVHQWKQSLVSLEKQDRVLSEIRNAVRSFEDGMQTLQMEIASHKKSVRKELERNEMLTVTLQYRESDIARCERELKDAAEKKNSLLEEMDVIKKIIEMTENELIFLNDGRIVKEKELEAKEREIQKCCSVQKSMEKKYMDVLHKKITITKASKYTEKLIKDIRKSIELNEEKGSKKERERTKLLLELGNLKTYLNTLEENLDELQKESNQRGDLLDRSEANALKIRDKIDIKRNECKNLENELQELIARAGGQELAPFERELANLRKEINVAEQGKRDLEQEYLRHQHELFSLNRQSSVKSEENDMYKKKLVILEGKKFQLEVFPTSDIRTEEVKENYQADIAKEEKDIKDIQNRIICIEKEIANVNRLLNERKELKECLKQAAEITKSDFKQTLKEAELNYLQKQAELNLICKKKRKTFSKMMEMQKYIVFWEQKVRLADETRRILKSEAHISELFNIRSEIRRLQLKQNQIKKEQENISKEMTKAAYRHTDLYVEADKQALLGKRRKTPEYAKKKIRSNKRKIVQDKKALGDLEKQKESLKNIVFELEEALIYGSSLLTEMKEKINTFEQDAKCKQQAKCQAIIRLSYKQKKTKLLQKIKDGSYVRAVRNEEKRQEEIMKIQNSLRAIQIIIQATINEQSSLTEAFGKVLDYIMVSKEL